MGEFSDSVQKALVQASARHDVMLEIGSANPAQRDSIALAQKAGWVPKRTADGVVLLEHPNLESVLQIFANGLSKRVKHVSAKA